MKLTTLLFFVWCACVGANARPLAVEAGAAFTSFEVFAFDKSSAGIAVRLSYTVSEWLSFEAGYFDPSKVNGSTLRPGMVSVGPNLLTLDPWIATVAPVFTWSPLPRFSAFVKTGYAYSHTFRRYVGGTAINPAFTLGEDRKESHFFWAIGLQYVLSPRVSLSVDYGEMKLAGVSTSSITPALRWAF